MQLRENARPMTDEESDSWMKRQEDINWAMREPDSSPGLVAWVAGAVVLVVLGLAWVLS